MRARAGAAAGPLRVVGPLVMLVGACLTGRQLYLSGHPTLAPVLVRLAWDESVRAGALGVRRRAAPA